jgi:transcriptional regulator GlxA family with amidase domain
MLHSSDSYAFKRAPAQRAQLRVGIILADRFTLSAFATFVDHLRLAADEGDRSRPLRVKWSLMSAGRESVSASCGVRVQPTTDLLPPESLDYVVVVGGTLHCGPQVDDVTLSYLRRAGSTRTALVGICTGSFILCRARVMQGHRSCVSWYHYQDFREMFPDHEAVADRLFLADGLRITCAGGAGTAALAATLIERHLGRAAALKANQILLFDRPRGAADLQPHAPISACADEPRVRRALLLMEQNLTRRLAIRAVATELEISVRQLERLCRRHFGVGPAALYRQMRMRFAHWLIENTNRPVIEVAIEAGFGDGAHFCRQFKETYGLSPSHHRRKAHGNSANHRALTRIFD